MSYIDMLVVSKEYHEMAEKDLQLVTVLSGMDICSERNWR